MPGRYWPGTGRRTYDLHVLLRFELEVELFEDRLAVADLPEAWNAKMEEYLGIVPANDALGVLQDTHWAIGYFGYFPAYTVSGKPPGAARTIYEEIQPRGNVDGLKLMASWWAKGGRSELPAG